MRRLVLLALVVTAGFCGGVVASFLFARTLVAVSLMNLYGVIAQDTDTELRAAAIQTYLWELERYERLFGTPPVNADFERARSYLALADISGLAGDAKREERNMEAAKSYAELAGFSPTDIQDLRTLLKKTSINAMEGRGNERN